MPVTFVAYIDESGDTGLGTVKKPDDPRGATEWLVLSAFVVKIEHASRRVAWTQDVQVDFISKRTDLHFNELLPFKKTLVCNALAKKDAKCFVVMSNKKTSKSIRTTNSTTVTNPGFTGGSRGSCLSALVNIARNKRPLNDVARTKTKTSYVLY